MTGQMTREEALERISKPEMDENFLHSEFEYVANKLDLSIEDLQFILMERTRHFMIIRISIS